MDKKGLIKRLQDKYDQAVKRRQEQRLKDKPLRDRLDMISQSPMFVKTDFWCNECKKDCSGTGYKRICTINEDWPTAWYIGHCPKGHKVVRRITDKGTDPYYEMSHKVMRLRHEMRDALLDPSDPRFKLLYPKQYKELMGKK